MNNQNKPLGIEQPSHGHSEQKQQQNGEIDRQQILRVLIESVEQATPGLVVEDELAELLQILVSGERVQVLPLCGRGKKRAIQGHRIGQNLMTTRLRFKKRTSSKQEKRNRRQAEQSRASQVLFMVETRLLFNCIMLAMAQGSRIDLALGLPRSVLIRKQQPSDWDSKKTVLTASQLHLYGKAAQFLRSAKAEDLFQNLRSLCIQVNNQGLSLQEWFQGLQLLDAITQTVCRTSMTGLHSLRLNVVETRSYGRQLGTIQQVQAVLSQWGARITHIFKHKLGIAQPQCQSMYLPELSSLSLNPSLYYPEDNQPVQLPQSSSGTPIRELSLVSVPTYINQPQYLSLTMQKVLQYFPSLTHFALHLQPGQEFNKFNQLCPLLLQHCPLLQKLAIPATARDTRKQQGLRTILANYPFLTKLDIRMPARRDADNNVNVQATREWNLKHQIEFRQVHIQRLLSAVKVLESKGYGKHHCQSVMSFMEPLKLRL